MSKIALNLGLERGSPAYCERMEAEMIALLVQIKRHFEGDEQDLDVAAEYVANILGIEDDVRAAYSTKCETCEGTGIDTKNGRQDTCGDCHGSGEV